MALLRMESFDTFADADTLKVFSSYVTGSGSANPIITGGTGRRGTQSLRASRAVANDAVRALSLIGIGASGPTCVVGHAFAVNQYANAPAVTTFDLGAGGTATNPAVIMAVRRSGAGNTTHQVWFRLNSDGTIGAYRGTTLLGTTSLALFSASNYQFLEFKVLIHPSAGTVEIRFQGIPILTLSGINTQGDSGGTDWSQILLARLGTTSSASTIWDYDDLYVLDGTTSADDPRNDFLGDCRCDANYPNANGTDNDSTPSGGAVDRYTMVDEALADGDATYNAFAAAGNKDSYNYPNAPSSGIFYGVQARPWWKKTDAGTCTGRAYTIIGGTRYFGASKSPTTDYLMQPHVWAQKPSDSSDWTESDFNAAEFGTEKET